MSLQKTDIEKIAHLARLSINESDISAYADNLSNILQLVEQMNTADTRSITPMAHPLAETQRLRLDEVTEADQKTHFQKSAPATEDGLYIVPKVIE